MLEQKPKRLGSIPGLDLAQNHHGANKIRRERPKSSVKFFFSQQTSKKKKYENVVKENKERKVTPLKRKLTSHCLRSEGEENSSESLKKKKKKDRKKTLERKSFEKYGDLEV